MQDFTGTSRADNPTETLILAWDHREAVPLLAQATAAASRGIPVCLIAGPTALASCHFPEDGMIWADQWGFAHRSAADAISSRPGRTLPHIYGADREHAEALRASLVFRLDKILDKMPMESRRVMLREYAGCLMESRASVWIGSDTEDGDAQPWVRIFLRSADGSIVTVEAETGGADFWAEVEDDPYLYAGPMEPVEMPTVARSLLHFVVSRRLTPVGIESMC